LGFDVKDKILRYTNNRFLTLEEKENFYSNFSSLVLNPNFVWIKVGEQNITGAKLLEELKDTNAIKKLMNDIMDMIGTNEDLFKDITASLFIEKQEIRDNLIKFLEMLGTVKEANFVEYCEKYNNPLVGGESIEEEINSEDTEQKQIESVQQNTPSYSEIKSKIIQFFPKDVKGEIIDNEGVFEVLEKTAAKYNDEKIKEMYYFDEESGKFKWNI